MRILNDGYTLTETIPAAGRFPAITVTYRPALPEAAIDHRLTLNKAGTGKEWIAAIGKLLGEHLVSWDITEAGPDGKDIQAPINAKNLSIVPEPILNTFLDLVLSYTTFKARAEEKN